MARWTGTWLSGLGAAGVDTRPDGGWRGRRWGLPPEGAGAVATTGSRVAAFALDVVFSALIGALVRALLERRRRRTACSLADETAFAAQVLLLTALTGQSLGKRVLGIRVVRVAEHEGPPGFLPAAIRTALRDARAARGLHGPRRPRPARPRGRHAGRPHP